jgi:hypothetical protein
MPSAQGYRYSSLSILPDPGYFRWIPCRPLSEFQPRVTHGEHAIDLVRFWQANESGDAVITFADRRYKTGVETT